MTGKTHLITGVALASGIIAITNICNNNTDMITPLLVITAFGAILPDIDVAKSIIRKIFYLVIISIIGMTAFCIKTQQSPINWECLTLPIIMGVIGFSGLLIYGYVSKHRTFTHTLLALILFSSCIYLMSSSIVYTMFFAIGMLSHQVLDLLNKEKIMWLNPICKKDFATYLFNSKGIFSTILFILCLSVSIISLNTLNML